MEKQKEHIVRHWLKFFKNLGWLLAIVRKTHGRNLAALFAVSAGIAFVPIFQAYSSKVLINTVTDYISGNSASITFLILLISAAYFVPGVLYALQRFFERAIYFTLNKYFDLALERKRASLDIAQYEDATFNNFVNRVNEKGIFVIGNILTNLFFDFQSVITVIASALVVYAYAPMLLVIIVAVSIPALIVTSHFSQLDWYIWGDSVNAEERRKYWSIKGGFKTLNQLTEVKLFGLQERFIRTIEAFIESVQVQQKRNISKQLLWTLCALAIQQGGVVFSIVYLVRQALGAEISVGGIVFVIGAMMSFQNALTGFFNSIGRQHEDRRYIDDLITFLKTKPLTADGTETFAAATAPAIALENVTFAYPGSDRPVFKDFSLQIAKGEKVALIGLNGAGKTTFVKLLCRFYQPQSGRILLDGRDLASFKLDSWYRHLGVLFQDFARFDFTTVSDLISFGDVFKKNSTESVERALKSADAHGFVKSYANGAEQQLGRQYKDGVDPSGGQWQKLALARLFYRDPKVWILDEPTAAIDADAEAKIFQQLEKLPKDKTVILISHRFSTVRTADRIIVIDEGKVREQGTHEELMALCGEYQRLFSLQAEGYR